VGGMGKFPIAYLQKRRGFAVDDALLSIAQRQTSDPEIWGGGDCHAASPTWGVDSLERCKTPIDQAERSAMNMMGQQED